MPVFSVPDVPAIGAFSAALLVLALLPGCSGDSGMAPAEVTSDAGLAECEEVRDCRGGELCVEGFCRSVCDDDEACEGTLDRCEPVSGLCVQCLDQDDCAEGRSCQSGFCVRDGCSRDEQCEADEVCDRDTRECVPRGCERDRDCLGGEVCRDGACRPVQDSACTPDTARCEDGAVLRCDSTGTREVVERCTASQTCVQDGSNARCEAGAAGCNVGETGCERDGSRWVCGAGGQRIVERCTGGETCVSGQCLSVVCTPATARCDGSILVICDATGQSEVSVSCSATEGCTDAALGCTCHDGDCVERVCTPGSARCQDGRSQRCGEDGRRWLPAEDCASGETCIAGACVSTACTTGDNRCEGDVELYCIGDDWDTTDCGRRGQSCAIIDGRAQCSDRLCSPGARDCADPDTVRTCDADGNAFSTSSCSASQVCRDGACVTRACSPGDRRCAGNAIETCNDTSTGWDVERNCGADAVCEDAECREVVRECSGDTDCRAPDAFCDGETAVSWPTGNGRCSGGSCDFDATRQRIDCAASGEVCRDGACRTPSTGCDRDEDCGGSTPYCRTSLFGGTCVECRRDDQCSGNQQCLGNVCTTTSTTSCTSDTQCAQRARALGETQERSELARCDSRIGCYTKGFCGPLNAAGSAGDIFSSSCIGDTTCGDSFFTDICSGCRSDSDCREGEQCQVEVIPLFPSTCR
ncbi:MAG: hypothetical protein EA398_00250 [Deltaproteobacteria bacterium]|nr:MAG: hypothetical protein EA398_00250 [Deltaproteobacteria bacterium]